MTGSMMKKNRLLKTLRLLDFSYLKKDWLTKLEIKRYLGCSDEESFFLLQYFKEKYKLDYVPMVYFFKECNFKFNEERNDRYHEALTMLL